MEENKSLDDLINDTERQLQEDKVAKETIQNLSNDDLQRERGAEAYAMLFRRLTPQFKYLVDNKLSNKNLRRVLKALLLLPLEDSSINLKDKDEKEAFEMATKLMEAKNYMVIYTQMQIQAEQDKIREENRKKNEEAQQLSKGYDCSSCSVTAHGTEASLPDGWVTKKDKHFCSNCNK